MSKTLISFLGTGGKLNKEGQVIREYRTAKYSIEGKFAGESSFVTSVLMDHFAIDNLILIGTVKSMWEEAYRYFCEKNNRPIDVDYYVELSDQIDRANYQTSLSELSLKPLEESLGKNLKVVVIPYGLNKAEQVVIFKSLSETFSQLEPDHEIILDITHSFRSLPLFSTSVIQYLQSLSEKKLHFSKIYYGMLDAMREFDGVAPIIDISATVELQRWSTAAYSFKKYGKGSLLADLLGGEEGEMIKIFSDAVNINYLNEIRTRLANFQQFSDKKMTNEFAQWVVPKVLSSFTKRLQKAGNSQWRFQFELSQWHRERENYSSAYIVFVESILTYVCEEKGWNWKEENKRNEAKKEIVSNNYKDLRKLYQAANGPRKNIAHNLNRRGNKVNEDIENLEVLQKDFLKLTNKN